MRPFLLLRLLMFGVTVALGVVLLARGATVIGALVLTLAAVRLAMFATFLRRRRRRVFARRREWRRSGLNLR